MRNLTIRQAEILEFIIAYVRDKGYPPSLREISEQFSFSNVKSSVDHLKALEKKGFIKVHPGIARGITILRRER